MVQPSRVLLVARTSIRVYLAEGASTPLATTLGLRRQNHLHYGFSVTPTVGRQQTPFPQRLLRQTSRCPTRRSFWRLLPLRKQTGKTFGSTVRQAPCSTLLRFRKWQGQSQAHPAPYICWTRHSDLPCLRACRSSPTTRASLFGKTTTRTKTKQFCMGTAASITPSQVPLLLLMPMCLRQGCRPSAVSAAFR